MIQPYYSSAMAEQPPEIMSVKEASTYLGCPQPTVYFLIKTNALPGAVGISGRWRIKKVILDRYFKSVGLDVQDEELQAFIKKTLFGKQEEPDALRFVLAEGRRIPDVTITDNMLTCDGKTIDPRKNVPERLITILGKPPHILMHDDRIIPGILSSFVTWDALKERPAVLRKLIAGQPLSSRVI